MNVGELFIKLGIKGSKKATDAIGGVKKALSETASMSLEAKAGILAAMYALERLFAASGSMGTSLTNFNAVMGVSTKTLQEYQFAARQMGVANQETEATFKSLQQSMAKTLLGEGAPKGMARVAQLTGGISPKDIEAFSRNPELLLQKLQEYAQKEKNASLRNEVLKSFGVGDNMVAALTRNAFRPDVLKQAPTYNDQEIRNLDRANIAWSNLGNQIEMAVGKFNARHGGQLVGDISKLIPQVLKLVEAFTQLAEKLKVFEGIGKVFEGWTLIFQGITKGVQAVTGAVESPEKRKQLKEDVTGFLAEAPSVFKAMAEDMMGVKPAQAGLPAPSVMKQPSPISKVGAAPSMKGPTNNNVSNTSNFQQTFNFSGDGSNKDQVSDAVKKANMEALQKKQHQDAYRQFNQGQVN